MYNSNDKTAKKLATPTNKFGDLMTRSRQLEKVTESVCQRWLMADYEDGFSPLTLAVNEGHMDAVRDLIKLGADVNHADKDGYSAGGRCGE